MITVKTPGAVLKYFDPSKDESGNIKGWQEKPVEVSYVRPESFEELVTWVNEVGAERVMQLVSDALAAEAKERSVTPPENTFTPQMVNKIHNALKVLPKFASIEKLPDRKLAMMKWVAEKPERVATFYESYVGVTGDDSEE